MDDLLTILLVVGWMVLGIYQNSRKQKKRAEAKRQAAERERQRNSPPSGPVYQTTRPQENRPQKPPSWRKQKISLQEPNLEEVLGELLGMPAKPKPVAKPRESKPVETAKAEPYSPLAYTPLIEQINKPQYESIEFREEHKTPGYHIQDTGNVQWTHPELEGFDLRKAVIYSAILNRPYS